MAMALEAGQWTLEELHRLPDDGNKYELVRGELFVTPAPTPPHETVLARLHALLAPFVAEHRLGLVYRPRAVVQFDGSEVEPDLMVRQTIPDRTAWRDAPTPILVVEVASRTTARRDRNQKRQLYLDAGVAEYWIIDRLQRSLTIVRPGEPDVDVRGEFAWQPAGVVASLRIELADVLGGGS
jgi:Uma2 family endonuclease